MPVTITEILVREGLKVMRGKDWEYDNQDGGTGKAGTIIGRQPGFTNWWTVKWDTGYTNNYRVGAEGKYDLQLWEPSRSEFAIPTKGMKVIAVTHYGPRDISVGKSYRITSIHGNHVKVVELDSSIIVSLVNTYVPVTCFKTESGAPLEAHKDNQMSTMTSDTWGKTDGYSQAGKLGYSHEKLHLEELEKRIRDMRTTRYFEKEYNEEVEKQISKTNKTQENGRTTGPFKVRRPSCVIKGPEKRTRAFF